MGNVYEYSSIIPEMIWEGILWSFEETYVTNLVVISIFSLTNEHSMPMG